MRRALAAALVILALPACQAVLGIDTLSGAGGGGGCKPSVEVCSTADVDEDCDGEPTCTGKTVNLNAIFTQRVQANVFVTVDASDNIWATGAIGHTTTLGGLRVNDTPASDAALLAKIDANGTPKILKAIVGDDTSDGWGIATLPNGDAVVVGRFTGHLAIGADMLSTQGDGGFVAVFDGNTGDAKWGRAFAGTTSAAAGILNDVAVDTQGRLILCGTLAGSFKAPSGKTLKSDGEDMIVARFDADGNEELEELIGVADDQECGWIVTDSDGGFAILGQYFGRGFDLGTPVHATSFGALLLTRFDADAKPRWSRAVPASDSAIWGGVGFDPKGNVIVGGDFKGEIDLGTGPIAAKDNDAFLGAFDDDGKPLWAKRFGDGSFQSLENLKVDGAGQIAVTGMLDGTLSFGGCEVNSSGGSGNNFRSDAYVAKLSPDGDGIWCRAAGSPDDVEEGEGIALDPFGGVVIGGAFVSSFTLDKGQRLFCDPKSCNGGLYIARLKP